jgi:excinuclease ABC subunit C
MNASDSIKDTLRQIPELPGIYKMLDSGRNIIYIGKSKCLKKRVKSYFVNSPKWEKVTRMVSMIKEIEYIVTDTHLEARMLECELIKTHQPRFNAQMKNDKRYIYIKVDIYNPNHSLSVTAFRESDCFGPFRSKYTMEEFIKKLKNLYPIVGIEQGYEAEYHLFPLKLDKEMFERNRQALLELFTADDRISLLIATLQTKLIEAVSEYRYEIASYYRDIIIGFTNISHGLDGYKKLATRDILLKLPIPVGYKLFYITGGFILHRRAVSEASAEVIADFLAESRVQSSYYPTPMDEKSGIDYRDVLYSEISDLPEEMVHFLS